MQSAQFQSLTPFGPLSLSKGSLNALSSQIWPSPQKRKTMWNISSMCVHVYVLCFVWMCIGYMCMEYICMCICALCIYVLSECFFILASSGSSFWFYSTAVDFGEHKSPCSSLMRQKWSRVSRNCSFFPRLIILFYDLNPICLETHPSLCCSRSFLPVF